jgi:hypothetical protein
VGATVDTCQCYRPDLALDVTNWAPHKHCNQARKRTENDKTARFGVPSEVVSNLRWSLWSALRDLPHSRHSGRNWGIPVLWPERIWVLNSYHTEIGRHIPFLERHPGKGETTSRRAATCPRFRGAYPSGPVAHLTSANSLAATLPHELLLRAGKIGGSGGRRRRR